MKARIPLPFHFVAEFDGEELRRKIIPIRADLDGKFFGEGRLAGKQKTGGAHAQDGVTE